MATRKPCGACGQPNPEQAQYCESCGVALHADSSVTTSAVRTVPYSSTYRTMRATANFVSGVGWIVALLSVLVLLASISEGGMAGILIVPAFGGAIGGLLLVALGQSARATVDTADFTGEMLAIMKASWPSGKQ